MQDGDLAHLVPEARAAARQSDAERLALLPKERWWVAHDRAQRPLSNYLAFTWPVSEE